MVSFEKHPAAGSTNLQAELSHNIQPKIAAKKPRIHRIYYLLALFDLIAVMSGLFLSHHINGVLKTTVDTNFTWNLLHEHVASVRTSAADINAPGNDIFETKDAAQQLARLNQSIETYKPIMMRLEEDAKKNVPVNLAGRPLEALKSIESAMAVMIARSKSLLEFYSTGNIDAAVSEMPLMDRDYAKLLTQIESASKAFRMVENELGQESLANVKNLHVFEYMLGIFIIFMVFAIAIYGHKIGRMFAVQYDQISTVNETLQGQILEREQLAAKQQHEYEQKLNRQKLIEDAVAAFSMEMSQFVEQGRKLATQVHDAVDAMTTLAAVAGNETKTVSDLSEKNAQYSTMISRALEEVAIATSDIDKRIVNASHMIEAMGKVVDAARSDGLALEDAARSIGDVTEVIQSVADQTNLLALNATIEAARAGEFGRGFAVVASEVKSLAGQTKSNSVKVIDRVNSIRQKSSGVVERISEIGNAVQHMRETSLAIAVSVNQQAMNSSTIAGEVALASTSIENAAGASHRTSDAVENVTAAVKAVQDITTSLSFQADLLKSAFDRFAARLAA